MNELNQSKDTSNLTPIEIALGVDGDGMTTAKKLYDFLEMDSSHYSRWIKSNITENQFAEENVDYWAFATNGERNFNPNPTQDFKLSARFAKKLSMTQKNEKGELARDYFADVEDKAKDITETIRNLSPELQAIFSHDKKIQQVETKVEAVNADLQDFKKNLPLLPAEAELITITINRRAVKALGGKESNAYKDKSLRGKVYSDMHKELKRQFGVTKYKYIKSCQLNLAISVIEGYELPIVLQEQIKDCNAQINLD